MGSFTKSFTIPVFISHSWSHSQHYETLAGWLFDDEWTTNGGTPVKFVDTSVPEDSPIHYAQNESQLRAAIYNRISQSYAVVIPTGMYANHSGWIQKEIDGATQHGKAILAVDPWGQERTSSIVQDAAEETVGWNKLSVGRGVWRLTR